jgi:hypothetical protein
MNLVYCLNLAFSKPVAACLLGNPALIHASGHYSACWDKLTQQTTITGTVYWLFICHFSFLFFLFWFFLTKITLYRLACSIHEKYN